MNFNLNKQDDASVLSIGGELDALSVLDLRPSHRQDRTRTGPQDCLWICPICV
jgi:anti-anti-sigma regulatory factor